jgi:hypothetical protein
MTGRPAALSAFAFASTANVADSAIAEIRAEILLICEVCTMAHISGTLRNGGAAHPKLASFTPAAPCPYTSTLTMIFFLALARLKIRREGQ